MLFTAASLAGDAADFGRKDKDFIDCNNPLPSDDACLGGGGGRVGDRVVRRFQKVCSSCCEALKTVCEADTRLSP